MVLPPVPPPLAATTPTTPTMPTTTPSAARFGSRSGRCGDRGGQRGDADGRADRRAHRADAPEHRNRYSCDGLGQQHARCQKAFHHSAHPSFLSSHLCVFQAGSMRDHGVFSTSAEAHRGAETPRWRKTSISNAAVFAKAKIGLDAGVFPTVLPRRFARPVTAGTSHQPQSPLPRSSAAVPTLTIVATSEPHFTTGYKYL
jgi:hypothetical protein